MFKWHIYNTFIKAGANKALVFVNIDAFFYLAAYLILEVILLPLNFTRVGVQPTRLFPCLAFFNNAAKWIFGRR
jgi:hypothetical protein